MDACEWFGGKDVVDTPLPKLTEAMTEVAPLKTAPSDAQGLHVITDGGDRVPGAASTASAQDATAVARLHRGFAPSGRQARQEGPTSGSRILLVDDDPVIADMVLRYLRREGYSVKWLTDGSHVAGVVAGDVPDLVILDLVLPGLHGREVCRDLRKQTDVPILMLTALGDEADRVAGLEVGADDYLAKPFSLRELVLRVRAILRRTQPVDPGESPVIRDDDLLVDERSRVVRLRGEPVRLGCREYDLLVFFLRNPGEVFTRQQLLEHVWGWSHGDQSTVTVHVRRLRERIELKPGEPRRVVTVWGVGYRYQTSKP